MKGYWNSFNNTRYKTSIKLIKRHSGAVKEQKINSNSEWVLLLTESMQYRE